MAVTSRESFLEKKILMLDKRLTLIEKFVESRFCGGDALLTFRDNGNSSSKKDDQSQEEPAPKTPETQTKGKGVAKRSKPIQSDSSSSNTKSEVKGGDAQRKIKPAPASVKKRKLAEAAIVKENEGRVTRAGQSQAEAAITVSPKSRTRVTQGQEVIVNDYERPRYNTRTRRSLRGRNRGAKEEEDEPVPDFTSIKREVETEEEDNNTNSGEECLSEGEADAQNTEAPSSPPTADIEEDEEVYFTFPAESTEPSASKFGETTADFGDNQPNDINWSPNPDVAEGADDDNASISDEEEIVVKKKPRISNVKSKSKKEEKDSPPKKRGRKPNPNPQIPKPPRKYPSSSSVTLSVDCVAKIDPTKTECPMCHQHVKNEYYQTHLETHVKERHLKCQHCDNRYFNYATLRKHMRIHEPEKYGKGCRICGKQFYISGKLLAHERFCLKRALEMRTFVDPGVIEDLKKRSATLFSAEIAEIMKTVDANKDPAERKNCPQCKRTFKATLFERHLRSHSNTRNWGCSMCSKAYYHKNDLKRHIAADHTSMMCPQCSEVCEDKAKLKMHKKVCPNSNKDTTTTPTKSIEDQDVSSVSESERDTSIDNLDQSQSQDQSQSERMETDNNRTETEELVNDGNVEIDPTVENISLVLVNAADLNSQSGIPGDDPDIIHSESPSKSVVVNEVIVEFTEES